MKIAAHSGSKPNLFHPQNSRTPACDVMYNNHLWHYGFKWQNIITVNINLQKKKLLSCLSTLQWEVISHQCISFLCHFFRTPSLDFQRQSLYICTLPQICQMKYDKWQSSEWWQPCSFSNWMDKNFERKTAGWDFHFVFSLEINLVKGLLTVDSSLILYTFSNTFNQLM